MIMLPLQGDGGEKSSATRRYLKITDFEDGRASAGHGIEFFEKRMQDDENAGPRDDADSGNMEVVVEEEEEEGGGQHWQTSRLDPLWEGLGSLGEQLAGVDDRFDQLDQEICHDREASKFLYNLLVIACRRHISYFEYTTQYELCLKELEVRELRLNPHETTDQDASSRTSNSRQVIENFQREAQEEADMAAKDLADSWARRAARPAKHSSVVPSQVRHPQRHHRRSISSILWC